MVRSTSVAWKMGLAFVAMIFSWQQPALAEDGSPETVAVPQQPIEPKEVRVIMQPPADEAVFAFRPPGTTEVPSFRLVKPADNTPAPPPGSEPEKIREEANSAEPPLIAEPSAQVAALPADDAAISPPPASPEPAVPEVVAALPEADAAAPRAEPEPVEPRPQAAKAVPAPLPPLPERMPFRSALSKIKPFEIEEVAAVSPPEKKSKPALFANVNKAFRSLSDTITGRKREEEATASGDRPAAANAALAGEERAEEEPQSSGLLDKLRFW